MANGRGAWSLRGKDNGVVYYQVVPGKPLDGSTPDKGPDYQAVNLGVQAIQRRVNQITAQITPSTPTPGQLEVDGWFGPLTAAAAGWVAERFGVDPGSSPRVGSTLARRLWHDMIREPAATHRVPAAAIWGIMLHESSADPGAVGYVNPDDHGLLQINGPSHPGLTLQQMFDPAFSFGFCGNYLAGYAARFAAKGPQRQHDCMVAAWNSPAKALRWYQTGTPPDSQIYNYVTAVAQLEGSW